MKPRRSLSTTFLLRTINKSAFLFLLDLKKAYDTLDRSFLYRTLVHLGLPPFFVKLVQSLHDGSSMRLYINGSLGKKIPVLSGVRQGCPLAPQLFICAIELFHRFSSSRLPLFCPSTIPKTLACYADDISIFVPKLQDLHIVKQVILSFSTVSNEYPNWEKCAVLPLGPARFLPPDLSLGVPFLGLGDDERLLGVRLSPSESTDNTWSSILASLSKKLPAWSCTFPTMADRSRIINFFLCPIFEFQAKFQPPSPRIWKQLHFLIYNFAASNKIDSSRLLPMLWSYDALHSPSFVGGVGVILPTRRLHALSIQRVFGFFRMNNPSSLYLLSVIALPLGWRTFLANPLILRSSFPFSVRWKHDLLVFLSSCPPSPPLLHPEHLLLEPLAFSRWILKGKLAPFGLIRKEEFLFRKDGDPSSFFQLQHLVCSIRPGIWRLLSRDELSLLFGRDQADVLMAVSRKVPASWLACLSSFSFSLDFLSSFPYASAVVNGSPGIFSLAPSPVNPLLLLANPLSSSSEGLIPTVSPSLLLPYLFTRPDLLA